MRQLSMLDEAVYSSTPLLSAVKFTLQGHTFWFIGSAEQVLRFELIMV